MTSLLSAQAKILDRVSLINEVTCRQSNGERGVFTNGCFDLLHLGHVRYLQDARSLDDFLVLGLNGDESVRVLKAPTDQTSSCMKSSEWRKARSRECARAF